MRTSLLLWVCQLLSAHSPVHGIGHLRRNASSEGAPVSWQDPDIVLEGGRWRRIPAPFAEAGGPRPFPPVQNLTDPAVRDGATVMVLIAALRESRLLATLESAFSRAASPSRVRVGVVQQSAAGEGDVLVKFCARRGTPLQLRDTYAHRRDLHRRQDDEDDWGQARFTPESLAACEPARRVRVFRMDASEAAGPVFARAQQRRLLGAGAELEDFCLQIDAHSVFVRSWDTDMLEQFALTGNEYAVLSTYPTNADSFAAGGAIPNINGHWEVPHICTAHLLQRGVVRNDRAASVANLRRPVLGKLWGAGLSFSRCHAERDVPADPQLRQVFDGEEFSRGARLWTSGYDFYTPMRPALGTYYADERGGQGGWLPKTVELRASAERLQQLLCHSPSSQAARLDGYGLGNRRLLEDYLALTGMDTINNKAANTPCLARRWTPWRPGADAPYQPARVRPPPLAKDL